MVNKQRDDGEAQRPPAVAGPSHELHGEDHHCDHFDECDRRQARHQQERCRAASAERAGDACPGAADQNRGVGFGHARRRGRQPSRVTGGSADAVAAPAVPRATRVAVYRVAPRARRRTAVRHSPRGGPEGEPETTAPCSATTRPGRTTRRTAPPGHISGEVGSGLEERECRHGRRRPQRAAGDLSDSLCRRQHGGPGRRRGRGRGGGRARCRGRTEACHREQDDGAVRPGVQGGEGARTRYAPEAPARSTSCAGKPGPRPTVTRPRGAATPPSPDGHRVARPRWFRHASRGPP